MTVDAGVTAAVVLKAELERARERPPALPPELAHLAPEGYLERLAYHEAGHAIAERSFGYPVVSASIEGNYASGGRVIPREPPDAPPRDRIVVLLAGAEAEKRAWPALRFDETDKLHGLDLPDARFWAAFMHETLPADPRVAAELERLRPEAARIVARHWRWLERVAAELVRWRRLTGTQIDAVRPKERAWRSNSR